MWYAIKFVATRFHERFCYGTSSQTIVLRVLLGGEATVIPRRFNNVFVTSFMPRHYQFFQLPHLLSSPIRCILRKGIAGQKIAERWQDSFLLGVPGRILHMALHARFCRGTLPRTFARMSCTTIVRCRFCEQVFI